MNTETAQPIEARPTADLLALIADDRSVVNYRPRWNQFTGSMTATILLSRLVDCWIEEGRRPFYKFAQPCKHHWYRPGESWVEELGIGRREFEHARKLVTARTRGELSPTAYASYWVDAYRLTWYAVNEDRLLAALGKIGPSPEWSTPPPHLYQPPLRNLATRIQFNSHRAAHYRALVERDGEYCRHCGATQTLTIDHILAIANGGGNELDNLQLLCRSCNSRKGAQ